jgi:hypothetical protein
MAVVPFEGTRCSHSEYRRTGLLIPSGNVLKAKKLMFPYCADNQSGYEHSSFSVKLFSSTHSSEAYSLMIYGN